MTPKQPIIHEGKEYNEYAISINGSIVPRNTSYTSGVNITFTPIREDENGKVEFIDRRAVDENGNSYVKKFSSADIRNCGDMVAIQSFVQVLEILENFAKQKGWVSNGSN